ncbi:hydroxymethylglutaryl-CoA synthase [Leucobacter sp. USHLN153]|uniref:hydroxymethylglutaryl-CoA synthase n=1 Tax=Leucobacter sp. USHLN153 TaxID=3081268 RepID=UPI003016D256
MTAIGIHDIELASTHHVLDLAALAATTGVDPDKYRIGLGQDEFSVPAPDEDIVTMGATAALAVLDRNGLEGVRTLLFATESGIDHSKAAGVFVHQLLGLPPQVRVAEIKQACYGGTAAIQAAIGIVQRNPRERVLVIASDVARYALDSPGEPTQGAGAAAILIAADPALIEIEPATGLFSANVDDFWRPNDSSTAIVDGKLSISAYLDAMTGAWDDLAAQGGPAISAINRLIYHQPYTKMARKAQARLAEYTGVELGDAGLAEGAVYNRRLGNAYTASLYAGVASVLDHESGLTGKRLGLFSYGSGSVSEFLTGVVQTGAESRTDHFTSVLDSRVPLSVPEYRELHARALPSDTDVVTPRVTAAPFRFAGIEGRARRYERR